MDITPLIPRHSQVIQAYGPEGFKISGQSYETSVFVTAGSVIAWPMIKKFDDIRPHHFDVLTTLDTLPEILLLGTGKTFHFLDAECRAFLKSNFGLIADAMDTGAASRTYNVLLSEGRPVCAALVPFV